MTDKIDEIQNALVRYGMDLPEEEIRMSLDRIDRAQRFFPVPEQCAMLIKILKDWEIRKEKKIITFTSEACRIQGGPCVTTFAILSADWPGLSDTCLGVIHEMGWNIYFIKAISILEEKENLGIVIIGVRTDSDDEYHKLTRQTETIVEKIRQAAVGTRAKTYLLSEEYRKLEIYSLVIAEIEKKYHGDDLELIIGLNGEAVKYFAARSRDYIENRKIEDITQQIIRNHTFIKKVQESGDTLQLHIANFTTKTEGTFTGVTVAGPARLLNLEDCLKTIELSITNFQLKHNREFTTEKGIALYRIEFVNPFNHPLSVREQEQLRKAFETMVLNKRRDRAQWIESIGGFEAYARAIIPLLVREAQNTGKIQVYQSVGNATDLFIDFKIIAVVPKTGLAKTKIVSNTLHQLENVKGFDILAVKPPSTFGSTDVFIVDLRVSLTEIENTEIIYKTIKEKIHTALGDFRDFDEGMRTMDTVKLQQVRHKLEGIHKTVVKELYYSIEDFFRISAPVEEIVAQIRITLEMLKLIGERSDPILILTKQSGLHTKDGKQRFTSTLICIAYPHESLLLQKILRLLEPYELTLSRLAKSGRDILICRISKKEKALTTEELEKLSLRLMALPHIRRKPASTGRLTKKSNTESDSDPA